MAYHRHVIRQASSDTVWARFVSRVRREHVNSWFSALLAICAGNSPVTGEFPTQRPVTRSFDIFFDLRLSKRLSKQLLDCWIETPSHPLWRYCNVITPLSDSQMKQTGEVLFDLWLLVIPLTEHKNTELSLFVCPCKVSLVPGKHPLSVNHHWF